jgi:hypothetical protein
MVVSAISKPTSCASVPARGCFCPCAAQYGSEANRDSGMVYSRSWSVTGTTYTG